MFWLYATPFKFKITFFSCSTHVPWMIFSICATPVHHAIYSRNNKSNQINKHAAFITLNWRKKNRTNKTKFESHWKFTCVCLCVCVCMRISFSAHFIAVSMGAHNVWCSLLFHLSFNLLLSKTSAASLRRLLRCQLFLFVLPQIEKSIIFFLQFSMRINIATRSFSSCVVLVQYRVDGEKKIQKP